MDYDSLCDRLEALAVNTALGEKTADVGFYVKLIGDQKNKEHDGKPAKIVQVKNGGHLDLLLLDGSGATISHRSGTNHLVPIDLDYLLTAVGGNEDMYDKCVKGMNAKPDDWDDLDPPLSINTALGEKTADVGFYVKLIGHQKNQEHDGKPARIVAWVPGGHLDVLLLDGSGATVSHRSGTNHLVPIDLDYLLTAVGGDKDMCDKYVKGMTAKPAIEASGKGATSGSPCK